MTRPLVLTMTLLIAVSIHSFYQWRRAEVATELATRVASISERTVKTNTALFEMATKCTHTLSEVTLNSQARVLGIVDGVRYGTISRPRKQTRIALNAPASP